MKKIFYTIIVLSLFSCSKNDIEKPTEGGYFLHFMNRNINNIMTGFGDFSNSNLDLNNIPLTDLKLFVITFPVDYSGEFSVTPNIRPEYLKNVSKLDITIEKNITEYYKKSNQTITKSRDALNLIPIEYRSEELKEFNITSTTDFLNKASGESLNSLFNITYIGPENILISALDKSVLENRSGVNKPISVDELVASKIMAPPIILIKCNSSVKPASPITTSFIIQMKIGEKSLTFKTVSVTIK